MSIDEIENLVFEYGDDLYRFCCYLTANKDLADELYQETFLRAVQLSYKINPDGNVKNYLLGIAVNVWKNYIRKKARRKAIISEAYLDNSIDGDMKMSKDMLEGLLEKELHNAVKNAVNNLPDKQRVVVILHYAQNISTTEIARILHIPKGTVLSRLAKARENIRKEMVVKGYEL